MSWFQTNMKFADDRNHASVSEIVACFRDHRLMLTRLALLVTGDEATANQSVVYARQLTVAGHSPFRDWLFEWAKAATITSAISHSAGVIRGCEATYKGRDCSHSEHLAQGDSAEREFNLKIILQTDPSIVIAELDALSRAMLVLRVAIRSSLQECVLRLNVSRVVVMAANCRAMTWLHELQSKPWNGQSNSLASAMKNQPQADPSTKGPLQHREELAYVGKSSDSSLEREEL